MRLKGLLEMEKEEENPYLVVEFQNMKELPKSSPKPSIESLPEDDVKFSFLKLACLLVFTYFYKLF